MAPGIGVGISPMLRRGAGGGISWETYWSTRKPTLLIVTGMRDTALDLQWTDNSAGDCSFSIYRSTDGVTYASIGTTVAGDTTYTATGLTAGVVYYFYVVGVKSLNESDPTNIYDTRFKITVNTALAGSANDTFVLPTAGAGYNAYVDWGDGGAEENITGTPGNVTHDYNQIGTFQIKIRGAFTRIYFNNGGDRAKLLSIDSWGNIKWSTMTYAFDGCGAMHGNYIDCPNMTSASFVTRYMFSNCAVFNGSLACFNTASVTDMFGMFRGCTLFNQSLATFNTSLVTTLEYIIFNCTAFKQSFATFNLASITVLTGMCQGANINAVGTTSNYDATLIAWAAAPGTPASMSFHGGTSKYSATAQAARDFLTLATGSGGKGWTITDGGLQA